MLPRREVGPGAGEGAVSSPEVSPGFSCALGRRAMWDPTLRNENSCPRLGHQSIIPAGGLEGGGRKITNSRPACAT
jgi:hypothetical protein